ncbi:MAG TPA: ABC transporter transmembrane domain-containing protein [Xanthobacteraceae bacterium]|nr:ABC transporter transmembrane domain-containing protein [Xanthobacteraceae bacterium]
MNEVAATAVKPAAKAELPNQDTERPPSRRLQPLAQLVPFVLRYPGRATAALVALLVAAFATLAIPLAVRRMIDFGFSRDSTGLIDSYFAVLVGVAAVLAAASAARFYLVTTLGERVVADLRAQVFRHVTALSLVFFDRTQTGEIVSRLTADTTQIKSAVGASVSIALRNLVLFAGASAMMVWTSPRLSGFVLAAIPVIVLPLVAFGRVVRRRSRSAQDTLADASAYAAELIGGVRTLQAFTYERSADAHFSAAVERAFAAARDATRVRAALTAIAIFLVFASVVLVLWVGAQDVMADRMTPGRLSQFVLYAVFAAGALSELSQVWSELSQAAGAAERLFEILAVEPAIKLPPRPVALPQPGRGEVKFDAVRFSYPTRPEGAVLNGVSFFVRAGERVALVGHSGAGKSTIFHLLLRFYDPTEGRVFLDGVAVDQADPLRVRERIAIVPQDNVIFSGTIAENIAFGRPEASAADIERAAELALVTDFARRLPQGLQTAVGERGVTLSAGQRQRVTIARAILRDAPLLLLDEATSALDAESETLVQAALEQLMLGRTTIVIAHRLATVLSCDRILVLDHGRIVEEGTHATLAAAGGLYERLAKLQFEMI